MTAEKNELLKGTLDLLILKVVAEGSAHGYTIARRIQERSEGALSVEEGSLYPALHRLEKKDWLESEWGVSEQNRRAKFYRLSRTGRKELRTRTERWGRISTAIGRVLNATAQGA